MKRLVSIILVSMLSFSLVACGGDKPVDPAPATAAATEQAAPDTNDVEPVADEPQAEQKTVKVGVCIYQFDDNFMTVYRNELKGYFDSISDDKVKYDVVMVDGQNDQAEQTNQVNTFIADNVDVLIMNLVQSSAASTVIELAKSADIPVVFINREPTEEDLELWDKIAYVGADARQSGTFQGEIINELSDKGDINGDGKVSYVMLVGDPENVDAQYRTEFSVKAIEDSGMEVDKLIEERGDWKQERGQEITANALAQFGDKVEVVLANNDAMALGAVIAIEAAGRTVGEDIYLVGVDALDEVVTMVDEGKITGTVLNDASSQSQKAADVAIAAVEGETLEKNYTVDYVKITK